MKPIKVLSLFDGMSCGQQALERAGIPVEIYHASEIDKYAIAVTKKNYPNTVQLGSVVNVDPNTLPIFDLLIGGSPCQSFSFAGKRKGMATKCETEILTLEQYMKLKQEGFEFEGQSYLFWEYMRILTALRRGLHSQMDLIVHNTMPRSGDPKKGGTGHLTRIDGKTYCLDTGNTNAIEIKDYAIRRLTPTECERLQTVKDGYTDSVSDTQRYKMLGNGWTIDVIVHIFNYLKQELL